MKIIFNAKERAAMSIEERDSIIALISNQGLKKLELDTEEELHAESKNCSLTRDTVVENLIELQYEALRLEEQVTLLKERNYHLEEKVNWLRNKTTEGSFIPSKTKPCASPSLGDSNLQPALVEVINKMESSRRERVGLSFSKSKRARKDKALIAQSEYFDKEYVANQLKQLGLKVKNPLEFFVSYGAALELSPSEKFDTKSYLAMNPDVKDSGINPLLHYIKHGKAEGRVLI